MGERRKSFSEEVGNLDKDKQRVQFVKDNLPELNVQNDEFNLGFSMSDMVRVLWIKSRRLLYLKRNEAKKI